MFVSRRTITFMPENSETLVMEYLITTLKHHLDLSYRNPKISRCISREVRQCKEMSWDENVISYIEQQQRLWREQNPEAVSPITLIKDDELEKPVYKVKNDLLPLLYMEVLCCDLLNHYPVKMATRRHIMNSIQPLMEEDTPMMILRLDIVHCSETIQFDLLYDKFVNDGLLSRQSIELLKSINDQYYQLSGSKVGIPRGLYSSTLLVEIFLQEVDRSIRQMPGVRGYYRYIDDPILFIDKRYYKSVNEVYDCLVEIFHHRKLTVHNPNEWTFKTDLIEDKTHCMFYYLGYRIEKSGLSPTRYFLDDFLEMNCMFAVKNAVDDFLRRIANPAHGPCLLNPLSQLLSELRLITFNHKKETRKGFYSNMGLCFLYPFLSSLEQLVHMDKYREEQIQRICAEVIPDGYMGAGVHFTKQETADLIVRRCMKYSFVKGMMERRFVFVSKRARKSVALINRQRQVTAVKIKTKKPGDIVGC